MMSSERFVVKAVEAVVEIVGEDLVVMLEDIVVRENVVVDSADFGVTVLRTGNRSSSRSASARFVVRGVRSTWFPDWSIPLANECC